MKHLNRNQFLVKLKSFGLLLLMKPTSIMPQQQRPTPLDPKLVQEFVRLGHFDLENLKKRLSETPALLNATTDWGGGDFESALGGASHMGRKDIVEFLIRQGARMDIFTAAMMGYIDLVKYMCELYPELLQSKGPHGITLLMHAQKGGDQAIPVIEYLNEKGITK
ncbi:MAG: hypothetical protein KF856_00390 [Cyclobacteriaceae bacterium]|nr:hypothetical protein [Cyclobacteriaceae bacterium]